MLLHDSDAKDECSKILSVPTPAMMYAFSKFYEHLKGTDRLVTVENKLLATLCISLQCQRHTPHDKRYNPVLAFMF